MGITSNFANVATVTRASTKTDAGGWDFTHGGTVGTLTEYASGVAAIHSTAGLLVEESSTNEITNPRCEGATNGVIGSGGIMPTGWAMTNSGTTTEIIGTGTEDGSPYIDLKVTGTPPTGNSFFTPIGSVIAAALAGETWTFSIGLKIVGGSLANMNGIGLGLIERTSGGGVSLVNSQGPTTIDSSHKRYSYSVTLSGTGPTAYLQPSVSFVRDGLGGNTDLTLRVYAPQLEEKAYPTSPVFPTVSSPAASTRAADNVSVPNGAWSNDNGAGTLYIEAVLNSSGISGNFGTIGASYGADVSADYIRFRAAGAGSFNVVSEDNNTVVVSTIGQQSITGPAHAVYGAIAWDTNDVAASLRGKTQTFDTSATVGFGAAKLIFASGSSSTTFPSQYVKDVRYWPKRLTNAELEALVGN